MKPVDSATFTAGDTRRWRLARSILWDLGRKGSGKPLVIPAGVEFESSVPWYARWIIHPDDPRFLLAALVHDFLLETEIYGRAQAAAEWFDGALAGGAPTWKAKLVFVAIAFWAVYKPGSY